jgi:protein involved in polysaccharide export with SLBB domain
MKKYFTILILLFLVPIVVYSKQAEIQSFYNVEDKQNSESPEISFPVKNTPVFGSNLFKGQFIAARKTGINNDYTIRVGDRIFVSIWGEYQFKDSLVVDNQGNIFIPNIGDIYVLGTKNSEIANIVKQKVYETYVNSNVELYINLETSNKIFVYVSGNVANPGRYEGYSDDSILTFLDQANGIDTEKGSFRDIEIIRNGKNIGKIDLYNFILNGVIDNIKLLEGDTILVKQKHNQVKAEGNLQNNFVFEFPEDKTLGKEVIKYAIPYNSVTNVSISGTRDTKPFLKYLSLEEFKNFALNHGDEVIFHSGNDATQLRIFVTGDNFSPDVIIVPQKTTLHQILSQIKIDPEISNYKSVYIERISVKEKQKKSLLDSINRISEMVADAVSYPDQNLRLKPDEALTIEKLVKKAKIIDPDGKVVVSKNNEISDLPMEDGDRIIIPQVSNIVTVSGEVSMPSSIIYNNFYNYEEYIKLSGGFNARADEDKILVKKQNGEVLDAEDATIEGGDEIVVIPKVKVDKMELTKEIADILYKMAISVVLPVSIINRNN